MSVYNEAQRFAQILREMPEIASDDEAVMATLGSETDFIEAVNRVLKSAKEDDATAEARKRLAKEYAEQASAYELRADKKRSGIARVMGEFGLKKLALDCGNVSLVKGRKYPKVVVLSDLPQGFYTETTIRHADKDAIKAAIAADESIPGVELQTSNDYIQVR